MKFSLFILSFMVHGLYGSNNTRVCPLWMRADSNQTCQCELLQHIECNKDTYSLSMNADLACISSDDNGSFSVGACPYYYHQLNYLSSLNSSVTSGIVFNKVMCGPLNREGLLCSKCIPGYGIPAFSKAEVKCVLCDTQYAWPLYLALVLIPITLFYILVIVFNFSATHPPITAYIFFCQLIGYIINGIPFVRHQFETYANRNFLYAALTVCDIWNLEVLRYIVPSFCLSENFTNTEAAFIELITSFYPLILIILTLILFELHAYNCRIVVCVWKPFHKCFSSLRRSWDPKSSIINAFATFLLLSSFKVCFLVFSFLDLTKLYFLTNGTLDADIVLYKDPKTKFIFLYKEWYFIPIFFLLILFVLTPLLLLCLYPTKLSKIITKTCSPTQQNSMFLFMDCFQGHYKNGTTGTYDYRSASSVGFVLRFLVCLILNNSATRLSRHNNEYLLEIAVLLFSVSLFYALFRPCKKQYMNVMECLLHFGSAFLIITFNIHHYFKENSFLFKILASAFLIPSVLFVGTIVYKVLKLFGIGMKVKQFFIDRQLFGKRSMDTNNEANHEPHRLTHPTQYTPLLQ